MFFKLCQECNSFFYTEDSYLNHRCVNPDGASNQESQKAQKQEAEKKANTPPPAPPEKDPAELKKEQHKKLLIAMKTRLNNEGADASTLKFDATEKLFIDQFGAEELESLKKVIAG